MIHATENPAHETPIAILALESRFFWPPVGGEEVGLISLDDDSKNGVDELDVVFAVGPAYVDVEFWIGRSSDVSPKGEQLESPKPSIRSIVAS